MLKPLCFSRTLSKAINLDSIVDLAMQVCLKDFQETAVPLIVKINSLVDFESLILDILLASLYPSSTTRYIVYCNPYVKVYHK
jgi:hypothetical protein